ncbi:MAG: FAD:protein FMN transferase [bacterium]
MHSKKLLIAFIAILAFIYVFWLTSCSFNKYYSEKQIILGTVVEVTIPSNEINPQRTSKIILNTIKHYDDMLSYYNKDSYISRINKAAGVKAVKVPQEVFDLISYSIYLSELTNGIFDITYEPLELLWKKVAKERLTPTKEEIEHAKAAVGYKNIILNIKNSTIELQYSQNKINLGGIGKGYILKQLETRLKNNGIDNVLINLGGDVLALGTNADGKSWVIGIKDPKDQYNIIKTLNLSNQVALTSGNYERFIEIKGKLYHHIINPITGYPVKHDFDSVTLVHDNIEQEYLPSLVVFLVGKKTAAEILKKFPSITSYIY